MKPEKIKRIINPKYPYEYLRDDFSAEAFEEKLFAAEETFRQIEADPDRAENE